MYTPRVVTTEINTMITTRNVLRLTARRAGCRRTFANAQSQENAENGNSEPPKQLNRAGRYKALLEQYQDKITFNSHLESNKLKMGNFKWYLQDVREEMKQAKENMELKKLPPLPVFLQYVVEEDRLLKEKVAKEDEVSEEPPNPIVNLPYSKVFEIQYVQRQQEQSMKNNLYDERRATIKNWMTNYEYFDDREVLKNEEEDTDDELEAEWTKYYGTPDPTMRVSRVQCAGCGAFLHCTDISLPGYIPSEIFKHRKEDELKKIECQRCHFLKQYNIALNVSVSPDEYQKLLSTLAERKALIMVMVDLLDFPCSIWPGIVDIIGTKRPIYIVGNKVDLIPGDGKGYLARIQDSLMDEIKKTRLGECNIQHVSLVSAKTGYGIEKLITRLFKTWLYKGDVFLVGCTNVGKSSLFNALLQSDYCKVHALDIIKRATVSRWPGTTLNMLKFPINRPSGWKTYMREKRLKYDERKLEAERELQRTLMINHKIVPTLIGHIGRTFFEPGKAQADTDDMFNFGISDPKLMANSGLDEKNEIYKDSRWFFDTPGVVHPEQVLSLLTTEELLLVLPKAILRPQTYYLREGTTIFIAGLARIDFLECTDPARFTVFCAKSLPITITYTKDAEEVYEKFLGTELLAVPTGTEERLSQWPGLEKHEEVITMIGEGDRICVGDIVLSSVGWVSVQASHDTKVSVRAWTPQGRGVNVRTPSMLPYAVRLKGKRVLDTPAYRLGAPYIGSEEDE